MTGHGIDRRNGQGFALITALIALGVCAAMGAAYVAFMAREQDEAQLQVNTVRARVAATAGVQAAIAQIQQQLAAGQPVTLGELAPLDLPAYKPAEDGSLSVDGLVGKAAVAVEDESARLNVNFAPARVLAAVLGIDPNKAREIRSQLPKIAGDDAGNTNANAHWLTSVDELVFRGLVDQATFDKINPDLLTVYTVPDPANPMGFVNLNTAKPEVLAAVLGVAPDVAAKAARPFGSAADVAAAAGKDASAFNYPAPADAPGSLPKELALNSRTFRIVSTGTAIKNDAEQGGKIKVEAVVYVDEAGRPVIRYWDEQRGEAQPEGSTPAPEAPANAA